MKTKPSLARVWGALAAVALISAACVPIPDGTAPILTPTASVFLPNVEAPGGPTSPLQPTTAPTSSALLSTAVVLTPALSSAAATATPGVTPVPTYTVTPTPPPVPTLVGHVWEWVSSALKDSPALAPSDPSRYTFQLLGDGNALIQADCNFGAGSYEESGESFAFTAIGTTKVACPPDSLDSAFLAQLRYIASYRFEADELVIALKEDAGRMRLRAAPADATGGATPTDAAPTSASNRAQIASPTPLPTDTSGTALPAATAAPLTTPTPLLTATPAPTLLGTPVPASSPVAAATVLPALSGTKWMLVSLTANGQAIPPVGSTPITLEIAPDGKRISGSTGCNQYSATLNADAEGAAVLGPALTTEKACAANLMVQEVEFMDGLLRTRSYVLQGNELTLVDVAGNSLMVLVRK